MTHFRLIPTPYSSWTQLHVLGPGLDGVFIGSRANDASFGDRPTAVSHRMNGCYYETVTLLKVFFEVLGFGPGLL